MLRSLVFTAAGTVAPVGFPGRGAPLNGDRGGKRPGAWLVHVEGADLVAGAGGIT
jgi:hypothetical protein